MLILAYTIYFSLFFIALNPPTIIINMVSEQLSLLSFFSNQPKYRQPKATATFGLNPNKPPPYTQSNLSKYFIVNTIPKRKEK
jgi:hypothetical protein